MVTTQTKLAAVNTFGPARATVEGTPLTPQEIHDLNAYWRAWCYLILGMLYLRDNPLLRESLRVDDIKHRLLGHWGSSTAVSL